MARRTQRPEPKDVQPIPNIRTYGSCSKRVTSITFFLTVSVTLQTEFREPSKNHKVLEGWANLEPRIRAPRNSANKAATRTYSANGFYRGEERAHACQTRQ